VIQLAFVGFRHGHIFDLYRRAQESDDFEVVAGCEEDKATRETLAEQGTVSISHDNFDDMLSDVACDAVAVGDYYGKRGERIIAALSAGKHVIVDKPVCTRLSELDEIERLVKETGLRVACMLDMRDSPQTRTARTLVQGGTIGEVKAISFGGQHPLLLGTRPNWYFEPGKHGGTINDIAIHALDALPWITGLRFTQLHAARCWNALASDYPHFEGAGQMMLSMDNGCGVLGDVSYLAPDSQGYTTPFYWRITLWGEKGILEFATTSDQITLALDGEEAVRQVPLGEGDPGGYLRAMAADIAGTLSDGQLSSQDALRAARLALTIQQAADTGACNVPLA
jgi:predicted dehydrogenase